MPTSQLKIAEFGTVAYIERELNETVCGGQNVELRSTQVYLLMEACINHEGVTPACRSARRTIEERSQRQQSKTEIGVLTAITGHGLTPPEGGTSRHRRRVTQPPPLLHPEEKQEPTYLSGGFLDTYSC
ncbi:hypothetical protein AVEN_190606-1 [Araneus ventricosus]|uniref:Uncharacterized protein n=1 Tax=Araneus ventricosus TaxID=182803 RepID=A0A4Y2CEL2_ARAVE|nr:hypothetical protein AVEN_190606-1 [Araneus ventricosus]